jgi:hypothetical protein
MCRSSYSVFVEVCMPWASAIKHLLCRHLWLPSAPFLTWLRDTSAAATMVIVSLPR